MNSVSLHVFSRLVSTCLSLYFSLSLSTSRALSLFLSISLSLSLSLHLSFSLSPPLNSLRSLSLSLTVLIERLHHAAEAERTDALELQRLALEAKHTDETTAAVENALCAARVAAARAQTERDQTQQLR